MAGTHGANAGTTEEDEGNAAEEEIVSRNWGFGIGNLGAYFNL
jgi:hypothetical protein